jgi:hypothetical protein
MVTGAGESLVTVSRYRAGKNLSVRFSSIETDLFPHAEEK